MLVRARVSADAEGGGSSQVMRARMGFLLHGWESLNSEKQGSDPIL